MPPFLVTSDEFTDWLRTDGARIGGVILVALIADFLLHRIVPRAIKIPVRKSMPGIEAGEIEARTHTLANVFTTAGRTIIILIAALTLLPLAGLSVGPLLAGAGIIGIAVGFGAQSLVKDIISGLFILFDNQYSRGDVVTVGGVSGLVEDVGLRRTVLRDLDGIVHYVPNGEVGVASNFTQEYSAINMNVGVSYSEDLDHVMAVVDRVGLEMAEDPEIGPSITEPPHSLRVDAFAESAIEIKIVGRTKPIKQWDVMGELRKRLKKAFDEEGIEIPYPHQVQVTAAKANEPAKEDDEPPPAGE